MSTDEKTIEALGVSFDVLSSCVKVRAGELEKFISFDSFLSFVNSTIHREVSSKAESMLPPSNTYYIGRSGGDLMIGCYYAGGIREVSHVETGKIACVVPNIIISHHLALKGADYIVKSTKYFCTDLPVSKLPHRLINSPDESLRIFLLPFPNTYDSGAMCYGSNQGPGRMPGGNLRPLDWYFKFLFDSPFNNDLGLRGVDTGKAGTPTIAAWFRKLQKLAQDGAPFPYELLFGYSNQSL